MGSYGTLLLMLLLWNTNIFSIMLRPVLRLFQTLLLIGS
jgi:hypothetical protein